MTDYVRGNRRQIANRAGLATSEWRMAWMSRAGWAMVLLLIWCSAVALAQPTTNPPGTANFGGGASAQTQFPVIVDKNGLVLYPTNWRGSALSLGALTNATATNAVAAIAQAAAGMSNGNGAAITNLPLASRSGQGVVSTNQYEQIASVPFAHSSRLRTPMLGIDLWHGPHGGNWTDTEASNYITIAKSAGLVDRGWKYLQLTDGLWGSRTNGHLHTRASTVEPGHVHDITNLVKHAQANGIILGVYSEDSYLTSAAVGPGSGGPSTAQTNSFGEFPLTGNGAYIESDAADWAAMGIGYLQWDIHGLDDISYRMYMARRMESALRANTGTNQPIVVRASSFLNYDGGMTNFDANLPKTVLNSWRGTYDSGSGIGFPQTWDGNWQQMVWEYCWWSRYNYTVQPGGNYYFDSPVLGAIAQSQQATNQVIGSWAMWAMACSDLMIPAFYDTSTDAGAQYRFETNAYWLAIHQDPLVIPARCVVTNTSWSVWARPLVDGAQAVMLLNHSTNQNTGTAITVNWTNLGWLATDTIQVRDVLGDSNLVGMCSIVTNALSGYTRAVSSQSAALFIMRRAGTVSALSANVTGESTIGGTNTANVFVSTNQVRALKLTSTRELVGANDWTPSAYGSQPFTYDNMCHAASSSVRISIPVPSWATNFYFTYNAAADTARSWTNLWQQEVYDTGTRSQLTGYFFPVTVTGTTPVWQSNSIPLTAGKTNSALLLTFYQSGSNTTGNFCMQGPVAYLFQ